MTMENTNIQKPLFFLNSFEIRVKYGQKISMIVFIKNLGQDFIRPSLSVCHLKAQSSADQLMQKKRF